MGIGKSRRKSHTLSLSSLGKTANQKRVNRNGPICQPAFGVCSQYGFRKNRFPGSALRPMSRDHGSQLCWNRMPRVPGNAGSPQAHREPILRHRGSPRNSTAATPCRRRDHHSALKQNQSDGPTEEMPDWIFYQRKSSVQNSGPGIPFLILLSSSDSTGLEAICLGETRLCQRDVLSKALRI